MGTIESITKKLAPLTKSKRPHLFGHSTNALSDHVYWGLVRAQRAQQDGSPDAGRLQAQSDALLVELREGAGSTCDAVLAEFEARHGNH